VQVFSKEDTEQIAKSSRIKAILNHGDIYEHLHNYDVLITDFSGIFFDFLITGKPIIMAPINMDTYLHEDRELYYNYEAICPDTPCMHWDEVLNKIIDVCKEDYLQSNRYTALQKKFHTYLDAMSSRRVVRELASIT
jgi:CDP-glycerol glycerophosphotransferase